MPRTGRRRSLTIAAALAAALAAPAAAQAATFTVAAGGGTCGGGDLACETLVAAAGAVAPGDTVSVSPGTYAESPVFSDANVTITGSFTAPGVIITGSIAFTGNGGAPSVLERVIVLPSTAVPAVNVSGTAGVGVRDTVLAGTGSSAMAITSSTGNSITRSSVLASAAGAAAVSVQPGASQTSLSLESSILGGGSGPAGAGLSVTTGPASTGGTTTITARHITVAGSSNGILLDSSAAATPLLGSPFGSIATTVTDSIVLGSSSATNFGGIPPLLAGNVASLAFTNTERGATQDSLFFNPAKRNYHLRAGSPAIDKATSPGTSATDIDGQPRTNGAASDLGADEFVPGPAPVPTAPAGTGDGTAPAVVITGPRAGQKIKLVTKTTKTNKTTKKKTTTSKRTKIVIRGTAKDAAGIKAVVLTLERLSTTVSKPATSAKSSAATTTATKKCRWFNATKGIVLKSCDKPVLLAAKLAKDGTWTFSVKSTIKLGAGRYRATAVGLDNSGSAGNSAKRSDAIRTFTLTK